MAACTRTQAARTERRGAGQRSTAALASAAATRRGLTPPLLRRFPSLKSLHQPAVRTFSAFCLWIASISTRLFLYTLPLTCGRASEHKRTGEWTGREVHAGTRDRREVPIMGH